MLNIPSTVEALFKRDGVRKNFRVHFPNGELNDLTNVNIIQESVKFTESLCSQDVLKFGLTEASVIEFETVGVSNIYGFEIECGIEIDLSSLSAAQLADIASGTWDGVYTPSSSSDIGYAYFRVPYGVFRVESCPRDHQAMSHRKVQAYSRTIDKNKNFQAQTELMNLLTRYDVYNMHPKDIFSVCSNSFDGYTESSVSFSSRAIPYPITLYQWLNVEGTYRVELQVLETSSLREATFDNVTDGLLAVYFSEDDLHDYIDPFFQTLKNIYDPLSNNHSPMNGGISFLYPHLTFGFWQTISGSNVRSLDSAEAAVLQMHDGVVVAPFGRTFQKASASLYPTAVLYAFTGTLRLRVATYENATMKYFDDYSFNIGSVSAKKWTNDADDGVWLQLNTTLQSYYYNTTYFKSFANAVSLAGVIQGYCELLAQFVAQDRFGSFKMVRLDNSSPESVPPGQYSEFWWDEYTVLPIGSVQYSFAESGDEGVYTYNFGSGASVYDMTDNEVLKNMKNASVTAINTFLKNNFVPHLAPVAFTPIDMAMKGLPYLEAGDYLAVTAEDGTTAYSFDMRQEIDGLQVLTANIQSTSGEILENET